MVVYIDVLFVLNLIVNYFILLSISQLHRRREKRLRFFAGAALGALYASLMFFPQIRLLYSALAKLAFSVAIVAVSFRLHGAKDLLKLVASFYIVSILFGGIISAIGYFFAPPGLLVKNGIAYVDISPLFLILSAAGCYIVVTLFSRFLHLNVHTSEIYRITIEISGSRVGLDALLDNGNDLCDAISGSPVIIAEYSRVEKLIPEQLRAVFKTGRFQGKIRCGESGFERRFRVVPYGSIGNSKGMLPAFRPDRLCVEKAGIETGDVLVAVTERRLSDEGAFSALLNPRLFNLHSKGGQKQCAAAQKRKVATHGPNADDNP